MAIAVAAVVVNYNGGELLKHCLQALLAQERPFESIVVVDNASQDGSLAYARQHTQVKVVALDHNVGFAKANNLAVDRLATDHHYVALVNPDAELTPSWLGDMLASASWHPEVAAWGCTLLSAADASRFDGCGDIYHISGKVWRRAHGRRRSDGIDTRVALFSPCAAAALYRVDCWQQVGGMDEALFCYLEDVDLGFRLRLYGYSLGHIGKAVAYHQGGASSGHESAFSLYHGHRNLVWVFCKNMPLALLWRFALHHLVFNLISVGYYCWRGRGGTILRAKRDALWGLRRVWRQRRALQRQRRLELKALLRHLNRRWLAPYRERLQR